MQPGSGYSIASGQAGTSLTIDDPQLAGDPEQFRVTVMRTGSGYGVQVRKGFVLWCAYRNADAWVFPTISGEIQRFFSYPTGSLTVGPFATANDSPLMDKGGYVQIQPASVEGGSDSWGVYLLGCGGTPSGTFSPYVGVFADGSDAEVKSRYFNGGISDQIFVYNVRQRTTLEVETPDGTSLISFTSCSTPYQYNYNCQRYKIATLTWEGSTFVVEQHLLGQTTIPYPVNHSGDYCYDDEPPAWLGSPYYGPQLEDWFGAWTGYDKDPTAYPVQV